MLSPISWKARGLLEFILDRITDCYVILASTGAKAGADIMRTGDDAATQRGLLFSPGHWRKLIKPRWKRVFDAARERKPDIEIWHHSDGDIKEIIPDLIEIGVTILNPVQPECMDVAAMKRLYRKHLVFDGTIGTQSTMPFASVDEVETVVRDRKREIGYDGALILGPTHTLEPQVPIEDVFAFIEANSEPS